MIREKFNIRIPNDVLLIHNVLTNNNFDLFPVGGCVRDSFLKLKPKDWDLVTNAKPDEVILLFKSMSFVKTIVETGKQFGVINIITNEGEFEIATMRKDIGTGRRPKNVIFTNIQTDMLRRDLTINALFFDIDTSEIVDLVGGISDLKKGIVRTVGKPEDRFQEDRLRILRAIRFAGRFGSQLEPNVDAALKNDASLEGISPERIRDEFLKGVRTTKSVKHFLGLLDKFNLFDWIFKGLRVNKNFIEEQDPLVLLAFMLRDNDPQLLGKILNKLTFSAVETKAITFLVAFQQFGNPDGVYTFKKQHMNSGVTGEQLRNFGKLINFDQKLLDAFADFKLTVTGQDAMDKMNVKAGPEMGNAIKKMESDNFKGLL